MNNNDILVRLRYALDLKDASVVEIFQLGGINITIDTVQKLLKKADVDSIEDYLVCSNEMLDGFLNGLIIYKRGKQENQSDDKEKAIVRIENNNINNVLLKKVKIALSLTSDDMLDILRLANVEISKTELSAVLRKKGERHYKECGDRYARNFLKGLAMKYRRVK